MDPARTHTAATVHPPPEVVTTQFWHIGAARTKADRAARAEARRRLRDLINRQ